MADVKTRIGISTDNNPLKVKTKKGEILLKDKRVAIWREPPSDEDVTDKAEYDVNKAWKTLFKIPSCQQMMISEETQQRLQIVVGVNVSQEFPWKQIRFKHLRENLFDDIENGDQIRKAFYGYGLENHVLLGYAPLLLQNQDDAAEIVGDPFILFINTDDAKLALSIIQNIERYERWTMDRRLLKRPRRWVTLGSEEEVNLTLPTRVVEAVDVEIQGVYPLSIPEKKEFEFRTSADVRDGYIELVPTETMKFDNVVRRRINASVQASPQLVNTEQQTINLFPTNAWAQYHYEIEDGEDDLDVSSIDEEVENEPVPKKPTVEPEEPKPPPELSEVVHLLLKTLEFNQIDMYRYDYPLLSAKEVPHHTVPYLEESLCFANISKSSSRFVCGIDWYPKLSGLVVVSYTFDTRATVTSVSTKVDWVQRAVLQPNPILMWSFSDNLDYKLEFLSPFEIVTLSFCPQNYNALLGGTKTGQLIVWDLQNRAEKLDMEEVLTSAQSRYRIVINDFLKWSIQINEDTIVPPSTITSLEVSQKGAITGFTWVGSNFFVNNFGKIYKSLDNTKYKFFLTTSVDGTISFWNLDSATEKKQGGIRRELPKALTQNESIFKGKVLKPIFTAVYNEPITTIISDTPVYHCVVKDPPARRKNPINYRTATESTNCEEMRQSVIVASLYGHVDRVSWVGSFADAEGRESIYASVNFARVHDGPVTALHKNPFIPTLFASIGRTVFAVWREDCPHSPIFWRKRPCDLTTVAWSTDRPTVLYFTRIDGNFEAWDLLSRDDDACLNDLLGGGIVTAMSEHGPADPQKLLGIGDYNSSFRLVKLPAAFYLSEPIDLENFEEYINNERARKQSIMDWEEEYYNKNRDVIEAKREAEMETRREIERLEREEILTAARKKKDAEDALLANMPPTNLNYPERMKRQWDKLNLHRMMDILMTRKRVDPVQLERDTAMEKTRLAYELAKKRTLAYIRQHVAEEVAAIRARILPAQKVDLERSAVVLAAVKEFMKDAVNYETVAEESNVEKDRIDDFQPLDYITYLHRGRDRRRILNKALGGNTQRYCWLVKGEREGTLKESNFGYEFFINANIEVTRDEEEEDGEKKSNVQSKTNVQPSLKEQIDHLEETVIE